MDAASAIMEMLTDYERLDNDCGINQNFVWIHASLILKYYITFTSCNCNNCIYLLFIL